MFNILHVFLQCVLVSFKFDMWELFSSAEMHISCVSSKINQKILTHIKQVQLHRLHFFFKSPFVFSFKHHILILTVAELLSLHP